MSLNGCGVRLLGMFVQLVFDGLLLCLIIITTSTNICFVLSVILVLVCSSGWNPEDKDPQLGLGGPAFDWNPVGDGMFREA